MFVLHGFWKADYSPLNAHSSLYIIFCFSLATCKIYLLSLTFIFLIMMHQVWFSSYLSSLVFTKFGDVFAIINFFSSFLDNSLMLGLLTLSHRSLWLWSFYFLIFVLSPLDWNISSDLFVFAHFFSVFSHSALESIQGFFPPNIMLFGFENSFIFIVSIPFFLRYPSFLHSL